MLVAGEYRFQGDRAQIWELLQDPGVLARCTPGCEELTQVRTDEYAARLKVGLAAVKGSYEGRLRIAEKRPPEAMVLAISASGTAGFVDVQGRMELKEAADGTLLVYGWDVQVGGPVAMVGQRVLSGVARWLIGEFFAGLARELRLRQAG